jgi:hypothetical protein
MPGWIRHITILGALLSLGCIPLPANLQLLPDTRGVLYSGGSPVSRALVWHTEKTGDGACDQPENPAETTAEGKFHLPGHSRLGVVPISLIAIVDYGSNWTVCARTLAGRPWAWEASTFGPPSAPSTAYLVCEFEIDALSCDPSYTFE